MHNADDPEYPPRTTLAACGAEGRALLAENWTVSNYPARAAIVSENDNGDDVFFVLDGNVRAANFTGNGREVLYSDLPRGSLFGILAALDGGTRSTNVFAKGDCRIARLSASKFRRVLETNADVNRAVLTHLANLVRGLSDRMTEATTLSTEQRLCTHLLRLAEPSGSNTALIQNLPTQQELATRIYSQRESVGREMSKLKDQGLVLREGKSLQILDVEGMEMKLCDP